MRLLLTSLCFTFFLSCSSVSQNDSFFAIKGEVDNYKEFENQILKTQESENLSPKDVLVVFDIDNTMLQNKITLGSEQWFYWQSDLLNTNSPKKVADDFSGLLRVQGLLFDLDPMKLTDENLDEVLASLQQKGLKTIILTSRGPEFRSATERTLKDHGLNFQAFKVGEDIGGTYLPYKLSSLDAQAKGFAKNKKARPVSYMNGIYMTAGQHKGLMLEKLLEKFHYDPKAIVFIDNHQKQVNRVFESFEGKENVLTLRFKGMDKRYQRMETASEKEKAHQDWVSLKSFLSSLYGEKAY